MKLHCLLIAVIHLFAGIATAQTPTPSPTPTLPYVVSNLGLYVYPVSVNDHAQVLSTEYNYGYGVVVNYRGTPSYLTSNGEYAIGLNNSGQVIGTDYSDYFLWTPDEPNGTYSTPDTLSNQADGINDKGEIAGTSYSGSSAAYRRSAGGSTTTLATLGGSINGSTSINKAGTIVGRASDPSGDVHGALWPGSASPMATPIDLGTLGGPSSLAIAINDLGDVAGNSTTSPTSWDRAFLYTGGVMTNLGVLSGDYNSTALDINGSKDVVGFSDNAIDGPRAFLYTLADGLENLNDKIGSGTGWMLTNANSVNECGQITGSGLYDDPIDGTDTYGYLLTPPNTAMVYDPDPTTTSFDPGLADAASPSPSATPTPNGDSPKLTAQRRCVRLPGLYASGMLDGEYATTDLTDDRAEETDGIFDYTRSERGFEEVMAYYHTDAVTRYLSELDAVNFAGIRDHQVQIDAHRTEIAPTTFSFYSTVTKALYFGDGASSGVDAAEDGMNIWHENFHSIVDDIVPGFGAGAEPSNREARAFNEGAADYWAASRFSGSGLRGHESDWDVYVSRWIGNLTDSGFPTTPPTPRYVTRVDFPVAYPGDFEDAADSEHENGLIWSSALWSIRQLPNLGRARTDRLLIRAVQFLSSTSARFRDISQAFLDANANLYAGADAAAIKTVLSDKGVYFELASLNLDPTTVVGGGSVTGQVVLTDEAPFGGAVVILSDSNPATTVPATVTVPKGDISATFMITTTAVGSTTSGNVTATYYGKSVHANLDVTP